MKQEAFVAPSALFVFLSAAVLRVAQAEDTNPSASVSGGNGTVAYVQANDVLFTHHPFYGGEYSWHPKQYPSNRL